MRVSKILTSLVIIFILVFILLLPGIYSRREIKNISSKGKNIICFGDSITFGYGVNPGEDYPAALAKLVGMSVINAGIDGDTSVDGLKRIKADVLDKEPYLVLIEFCGNDFIKKIPLDVTVANVKKMIAQAQAQGAMVAIVDVSAGLFLIEYRLSFLKLAWESGAIFVPGVLTKIITNPSMKSDFMHPNVAGYTLVAQRVYNFISPYLKGQGE
jgi:lysophospholipase L1-like esterase